MTEEEIQVFIEGALHYFERVTGSAAAVDAPYLKGDESVALEYTGVIGISGRHRGAVYFTAASEPLVGLLQTYGETDHSTPNQADLVGEIANTIAGNARRYFGAEFLISVPIILRGQLDEITLPRHMKTVVIPIQWRSWRCYLLVSLHKSPGLLDEVLHRRRG
jgi:chemotaxis protein CheX